MERSHRLSTCLLSLVAATAALGLGPLPSPGGAQALRIDLERLARLGAGDALELELPHGTALRGVVRRRVDHAPSRFTLSGEATRGPGSFVLAIHGDALAGSVHDPPRGAYRIRLTSERQAVIERVPRDRRLACRTEPAPDARPDASRGRARPGSAAFGPDPIEGPAPTRASEALPTVDVLVVYTREARMDAGGVAAIEAEIDLMMEWNAVVYRNSQIRAKMNLVYARELNPGAFPDLTLLAGKNDGSMDEVHGLRDAYGADQVAMVYDGQGGQALGLMDLTAESEATAFCVNGRESAPNVLSHELGHNMGCCHAINQGGGCPLTRGLLFPFSTGHTFMGNTGMHFTVMAGGLDQYFSEPRILLDGAPTGVFAGAGGHPGAENARTVTISAPVVATWRDNDGVCESLNLSSTASDCDADLIPDACEIALGLSADANGNSIPDECEPAFLRSDLNGDERVDLADLARLADHLGTPRQASRADGDLNGDGRVDRLDVALFEADLALALRRGARPDEPGSFRNDPALRRARQ